MIEDCRVKLAEGVWMGAMGRLGMSAWPGQNFRGIIFMERGYEIMKKNCCILSGDESDPAAQTVGLLGNAMPG